jgi:hypothetical protein
MRMGICQRCVEGRKAARVRREVFGPIASRPRKVAGRCHETAANPVFSIGTPHRGFPTMSTIRTRDNVELFYVDWGEGQPVVLSHGWPLNADVWEEQMFFLASNGYRVIAHDRRGHGRSTRTWYGNEMNTYADDLSHHAPRSVQRRPIGLHQELVQPRRGSALQGTCASRSRRGFSADLNLVYSSP